VSQQATRRRPGPPTILDVAALSRVSKSTVSNVLRGTGSVSPATRDRVLEAIATLGYRPNVLARNLVQQSTHTIGVVVGDLANTFYAELVKLLEREASDRAYTTFVCNTDGHAEREAERIESLLEHRVGGILLLQFSGDRSIVSQLVVAPGLRRGRRPGRHGAGRRPSRRPRPRAHRLHLRLGGRARDRRRAPRRL
jgi:DNA-binding LacI/PurR family transcriptional regulator